MTAEPDPPVCPICRKPMVPKHRPFCSPRCQQVDLGKWLLGNYRVETEEAPEPGSESTTEG